MKKISVLLLMILSSASVNASQFNEENSVKESHLNEESGEEKYSFVINKGSNGYEKIDSIDFMDNEKKDKVHYLNIRKESRSQISCHENLPDILSACCAFQNLKILDLKDFDFEEQYIDLINKIPSLNTIKLNINISKFDLFLKILGTLKSVEKVFVWGTKKDCYEWYVEDMPESFKTVINLMPMKIMRIKGIPEECYEQITELGLPKLGTTNEYEGGGGSWQNRINSALDCETISFPKNGIVTQQNQLIRCLEVDLDTDDFFIEVRYFPDKKTNLFTLFFNQNEDIPFQYNNAEGGFRVFTRKNQNIK